MAAPISVETGPDATPITLLQWNVDQAVREEQHEETKWINRADRVVALIREVDADVVCLQELRHLPGNETPAQFLSRFADVYDYELRMRNPSNMSFGQAVLFKKDKFFKSDTIVRWLSSTPEVPSDDFSVKSPGSCGFGTTVMGVKLWSRLGPSVRLDRKPLWVFNTHFALDEGVKTRSCHALVKIMEETIARDAPFVVCGDFNFFPDRDGDKQRAILCETMKDAAKGAVTVQSGTPLEGTFVGYEHDEFKASLVPSERISRLDHVFCHQGDAVMSVTDPILYNKTMLPTGEPEEFGTRKLPSDHLPVVVTVRW